VDRRPRTCFEQIRARKEFGIEVGEPKVNWPALVERKNKVVKQLTGGVKILLNGRGVEIVQGAAKLPAPNRVASKRGAAHRALRRHVMIATGASPRCRRASSSTASA
jgi:dihydrolipoamide dehydrogenase